MNIAVKTTAQNHNILNIYALPLNNLLYYTTWRFRVQRTTKTITMQGPTDRLKFISIKTCLLFTAPPL